LIKDDINRSKETFDIVSLSHFQIHFQTRFDDKEDNGKIKIMKLLNCLLFQTIESQEKFYLATRLLSNNGSINLNVKA